MAVYQYAANTIQRDFNFSCQLFSDVIHYITQTIPLRPARAKATTADRIQQRKQVAKREHSGQKRPRSAGELLLESAAAASTTNVFKALDDGPVTRPDNSIQDIFADLDFSSVKKITLDTANADVLYLLDCCHASTAGIRQGKELIAASTIEGVATRVGYESLTSAIVQELVHATVIKRFLTAAQLFFLLLEKVHEDKMEHTPIHIETMIGPQPKTSISLSPLGSTSQPSELAPASSYPLTGANVTPLGCKRTDLRVMLSVRLSDGNNSTLQEMREWLTTHRPQAIREIGVSFEYIAPSSSALLVFIMPVAAWYCLPNHPAITFISFVKWPEQ